MESKQKIYALPDFGFEKGGRLYITFFGINFTGVKLFMLSPLLREIFYRSSNEKFFCSSALDYFLVEFHPHFKGSSKNNDSRSLRNINDIYDSINNSGNKNIISPNELTLLKDDYPYFNPGIGYITINVSIPNVYLPILTNCENQDKIAIIAQYTNKDSFLDTREQKIQLFFTISLILYFILMLFWIINGLTHPNFSVKIHYLFTFSCLSKLFYLYFSCLKWKEKQMRETVFLMVIYGEFATKIIYFVILLSTTILACLGLGTYRIPDPIEALLSIFVSFCLSISSQLTQNDRLTIRVFGIISSFICYAVVVNVVWGGIESATSYYNILGGFLFAVRNPNMGSKVSHAASFCYVTVMAVAVHCIVYLVSLLSDSMMLRIVACECADLLLFIVDAAFFAYRKEFEPIVRSVRRMVIVDVDVDAVSDDQNEGQSGMNAEDAEFVLIEGPVDSELGMLTK